MVVAVAARAVSEPRGARHERTRQWPAAVGSRVHQPETPPTTVMFSSLLLTGFLEMASSSGCAVHDGLRVTPRSSLYGKSNRIGGWVGL